MANDTATIYNASMRSLSNRTSVPRGMPGGIPNYLLMELSHAGAISGWWSPRRDIDLRKFWKRIDHLAGAVYTMSAKMTSIPFKVIADDHSNRKHVEQAERITQRLRFVPQNGNGWQNFFTLFVQDLLTQDNGAFAEIVGDGDPSGPIIGEPITVVHLDAAKCIRTNDWEYPVLYRGEDGSLSKLHYTRVISVSSMTSPQTEMNGVGFCAVSRCINTAQSLYDILMFKGEKMGSRPHRAVIVTRGGLDPDDIAKAFEIIEESTDAQGYERYSKIAVVGDSTIHDAEMQLVELSSLPDGFDEQTSVTLGMAVIALAFGVDARELFPAMSAGATRADALLSHLKQRGKGPGQILEIVENMFNSKYLPAHLKLKFDFQDDEEDRQRADIKHVRSQGRERDLANKSISTRVSREKMLDDGDLTMAQFTQLELQDGRLPDGTSILNLFYSNEEPYKTLLDIQEDDPLNVESQAAETTIVLAKEQQSEVRRLLAKTPDGPRKETYLHAFYALDELIQYYEKQVAQEREQEYEIADTEVDASEGEVSKLPGNRLRRAGIAAQAQQGNPDKKPQGIKPSTDDTLAKPSSRQGVK